MAMKFTPDQMIEAIRKNKGMVYLAARAIGCTPQTVYNYAKRYKKVQAAINAERGTMIDEAELVLWKAVKNGEAWAVSLTLKTIGKHRGYVERQEVTGADGDAVEIRVVGGINLDDDI